MHTYNQSHAYYCGIDLHARSERVLRCSQVPRREPVVIEREWTLPGSAKGQAISLSQGFRFYVSSVAMRAVRLAFMG
jgi:hypothetical protein